MSVLKEIYPHKHIILVRPRINLYNAEVSPSHNNPSLCPSPEPPPFPDRREQSWCLLSSPSPAHTKGKHEGPRQSLSSQSPRHLALPTDKQHIISSDTCSVSPPSYAAIQVHFFALLFPPGAFFAFLLGAFLESCPEPGPRTCERGRDGGEARPNSTLGSGGQQTRRHKYLQHLHRVEVISTAIRVHHPRDGAILKEKKEDGKERGGERGCWSGGEG